jgi:sugar phosphate isomerase/epimerase
MIINPVQAISSSKKIKPATGFELLILATNWGFEGTWEDFCTRIKKEGYDGAEAWCPSEEAQRQQFVSTFKNHGLKFGFLVGGWEKDFNKHYQQFETSLKTAASLQPLYINCHSGRDHYSFEQNKKFIDLTASVSAETSVPIYHETHRSRILYSAPVARQFMEKIPSLQLTLDISHWCNVHESLLEDQSDTVALAISRTSHIHARVGHQESPQVTEPRAPEWRKAVDAHFAWWDQVIANKKKEGKRLTILTEFGPVDYMPAMPYTRQPLANQWEINVHMLKTLRERYS